MPTAQTTGQPSQKSAGGRPPKFDEPSRPITVTLPESTLDGLLRVDPDRGQAIVKLTRHALGQGRETVPQVEIVKMAANTGLIIVGPSRALRRIPFLHLVEVAPTRFLLALDPGNDFRSLEIAMHDVLDEVAEDDVQERQLLRELLSHIKDLRRSDRVSVAEILFVRLDGKRSP